MNDKNVQVGEAANYLENVVSAFGPDEGVTFDQETWARVREKIILLLATR